jgi:hypothetical protein
VIILRIPATPYLTSLSWAFGAGFALAKETAELVFEAFDGTWIAQGTARVFVMAQGRQLGFVHIERKIRCPVARPAYTAPGISRM